MKYLINITGPMASGKSTLTALVWRHFENYAYVDRPRMKRGLKPAGKDIARVISKKATYLMLVELMKDKNVPGIVVEEMGSDGIEKHLSYEMKKYGYQLLPFHLTCPLEMSYERETWRRNQRGMPPRLDIVKEVNAQVPGPCANDIVVDTGRMKIEEAFGYIVGHVK